MLPQDTPRLTEVITKLSREAGFQELRDIAMRISDLVARGNIDSFVEHQSGAPRLLADQPEIGQLIETFRDDLRQKMPELNLDDLSSGELYRQVIYPAISDRVNRICLRGH